MKSLLATVAMSSPRAKKRGLKGKTKAKTTEIRRQVYIPEVYAILHA